MNEIRENQLKKAQEAIAVVPLSEEHSISLLMRRFFNVLLFLSQEMGDIEIYRTPLSKLIDLAEYGSTNLEAVKDALRKMTTTVVEWNDVVDDKGRIRWGVSALLSHAEIIRDKKYAFVEWSFSPAIKRLLLNPSVYAQISIPELCRLSTPTATALYEICVRYLTNQNGLTCRETWQWWKPRLTGTKSSTAQENQVYSRFKEKRLSPAIDEINQKTRLSVELIEHKTGRKITHIQFSAKLKENLFCEDDKPSNPPKTIDPKVLERIVALGVEQKIATRICLECPTEDILDTLEYVQHRLRKGGVASPAALFRDAIRKGYGAIEVSRLRSLARPAASAPKSPTPQDSQADKFAPVRAHLSQCTEQERLALEQKFVENLNPLVREHYRKRGLKSKIVEIAFLEYVAEQIAASRTGPSEDG